MKHERFLAAHLILPLAIYLVLASIFIGADFDKRVADAFFYDWQAARWIGAGPGQWWARGIIHEGGRTLVRLIGGAALLCWLLGFVWARLRPVQRRAGYVALAIALATGIVGGLKAVTNVDCPWDYVEYGGERPRVRLFEDRPDSWPRAKCFPGAHSSSGFALLAFYFALRDSRKRLARVALAAGLVVGATFSVGQEARGAHFVSHDLTSAILVWLTLLGLYAWLLKGVTTRGAAAASPGSHP